MKTLSLEAFIYRLMAENKNLSDIDLENTEKVVSSLRLDKNVHEFFTKSADIIGMSYNAVIANTLKGVMLSSLKTKASSQLDIMIERFFHLFDIHAISYSTIPEMLKSFRIKLSDLDASRTSLLDILTEEMRLYTSNLFHINKGWLDGSSSTIYKDFPNWWNNMEEFARSIWIEKNNNRDVKVFYVKPGEDLLSYEPYNISIIIQSVQKEPISYSTFIVGYYRDCKNTIYKRWLSALKQFCQNTKIPQADLMMSSKENLNDFLLGRKFAADLIVSASINEIQPSEISSTDDGFKSFYEKLELELLEKIIEYPSLVKNPDQFLEGKPLEIIK